ncbi:hypothetical protein TNCV_381131 [Trichonephila clavipes]|uniref:Uncharacterized protein n=1 Tax=Trichonephila clavipes TaxID=2585209 RepID=A0A8X6SMH0_TRICX|nr:hypothetical protein TNCV_381131 [Trichonephila clavipes]
MSHLQWAAMKLSNVDRSAAMKRLGSPALEQWSPPAMRGTSLSVPSDSPLVSMEKEKDVPLTTMGFARRRRS